MSTTIVIDGHEVDLCPGCEGAGFVPAGISSGPLNAGQREYDGCPTCGGTGTR